MWFRQLERERILWVERERKIRRGELLTLHNQSRVEDEEERVLQGPPLLFM